MTTPPTNCITITTKLDIESLQNSIKMMELIIKQIQHERKDTDDDGDIEMTEPPKKKRRIDIDFLLKKN